MDCERSRLMPLHSPPFGGGPFPMLSAELLMVEFEAPREEIERITPAPFEPAEHNRLVAFIGDCSQLPHSLHYHECAILQTVKYEGREAITIPYIWTSTDTALLAGRELYGMPKMLCDEDRLNKVNNEVSGRLARGGETMMRLSMAIQEQAALDTIPLGPTFAFVRHVPSPDPDYPAHRQLIWIEVSDFRMNFCWAGRGWVGMENPLSSGLAALSPRNVSGGWWGDFSWVLGPAKILWEEKV
jgi:acetoacetate decarboxylase